MRKNIAITLFLITCFFSSAVSATENAATKDKESITDLTPWIGNNASIAKLYESEGAEAFFEKVTEYAPKGYTKSMVKSFLLGNASQKFNSLKVVDDNTIIIDDKITADYVHVGSFRKKLPKFTITWEIFKTDSKEMIEAGFKYFLFLPFHQHGKDSLRHAHLRYGNENFDFLLTDPSLKSWWPAIYQPEGTDEAKIMAQMAKKAKLRAESLPSMEKGINE